MAAAQQAYNVGRDATLNIVASGSPLSPILLTNFESNQETVDLKSKPLNGPPIFQKVPDGWKGSFEIDRANSILDDYFAAEESAYFAGDDANVVTILQTIRDAAVGAVGPVHQYRYTGVVLKLENAGAYTADAKVSQKVSFVASQRIKVS
ncbi:MAG TPA: hypothetical protein VJP88_02645 [Caulobacteraceae bacterium]|nr:hypothetical protein [Caulobacteraceae bacterium]